MAGLCDDIFPSLVELISLSNSRVEIMHLKLEYRVEDEESCDRELERFLHYVSII